ncbi:hypothetical protein RVR_6767 [Actinacidiphila reveromycinica]|uniref:Integral membrane protein n=1 Tax=Actinacidiphila reveromycinica TaxID=659352 RepID=A0A7U3UTB3_9ACTN|nr:hypothetical protein [Streptomyces sp. SN-593]BBA99930.1 hypothetical protein RVR_6767 [Streptomyces sp. SN-593]
MHHHHTMIAGAADPWEVAAGLEARGVTDLDAHRLRHRDVFGLAEELFARAPHTTARSAEPPAASPTGRPRRTGPGARDLAVHLLPGLACALAAALRAPGPVAVAVLAATAWPALHGGPLRAPGRAADRLPAAACALGLLALARCGPDPVGTGTLAVLALTLLPAAALARWFAAGARAQLAPSHSLADFADAVRPRLLAALAGYAATLLVLLAVLGSLRGSAAGVLLFAARLLAVHGAPRTAAGGLALAVAAQGLLAVLLPATAGPAEAVACGAAALALAAHALHLVPRASAHRT